MMRGLAALLVVMVVVLLVGVSAYESFERSGEKYYYGGRRYVGGSHLGGRYVSNYGSSGYYGGSGGSGYY